MIALQYNEMRKVLVVLCKKATEGITNAVQEYKDYTPSETIKNLLRFRQESSFRTTMALVQALRPDIQFTPLDKSYLEKGRKVMALPQFAMFKTKTPGKLTPSFWLVVGSGTLAISVASKDRGGGDLGDQPFNPERHEIASPKEIDTQLKKLYLSNRVQRLLMSYFSQLDIAHDYAIAEGHDPIPQSAQEFIDSILQSSMED